MKYYKTLDADNKGQYSGYNFTKYLPVKNEDGTWTPGKWMPKRRELKICAKGYHYTDAAHLIDWLDAQIFEVEVMGDKLDSDNKSCCQSIRFVCKIETWDDKSARLFACWCVWQIWDLLEDERSKNVVIVSEKYANGEATQEELAAARDAAMDVARDAARDVDRAVAWTVAWAVAWAADRDAAWAVQSKHLIEVLGLDKKE